MEEEIKNKTKSEVNSMFASLPIEIRGIIGFMLMFFLYMGGMKFITNEDNFNATECWKLEYKNDRIFKFNTCNGDVIEIDSKTLKNKKQN